jgi:hypothetical protein
LIIVLSAFLRKYTNLTVMGALLVVNAVLSFAGTGSGSGYE